MNLFSKSGSKKLFINLDRTLAINEIIKWFLSMSDLLTETFIVFCNNCVFIFKSIGKVSFLDVMLADFFKESKYCS